MLAIYQRADTETDDAAIAVHKYSFGNHQDLRTPPLCGCFDCLGSVPSSELREQDFIEEGNGSLTACCPFCVIGSVIGEHTAACPYGHRCKRRTNAGFAFQAL